MSNFKVGDMVKTVSVVGVDAQHGIKVGDIGQIVSTGASLCDVKYSKKLKYAGGGNLNSDGSYAMWNSQLEVIKSLPVIVIHTKGRETIATLKDGKTVIKTAKATCNTSDTFNAEFGRALALARLNDDQKMIDWLLKGEEKPVISTQPRIVKQYKYQVGDKVKVRSDLKSGMSIRFGITHDMANHAGKIVTISGIVSDGEYLIKEEAYSWDKECFDGKVIEEPESINFDWKGFLSGKFSVHCDTEEKAKKFLRDVKSHGVKWNSSSEIDDNETNWGVYTNNTVYLIYGSGGLVYGTSIGKKNIVHYTPNGFIKVDISEFSTDEIIEELKKRLK